MPAVSATEHIPERDSTGSGKPAEQRDRIRRYEVGCVVSMMLLLLWCLLIPTWRGAGYHFDQFDTHRWQRHGAFGITGLGSGTFSRRSPLWDPPGPSGGLTAEIRWPFQPVTQPHCIEIDFAQTTLRFWLTLILFAGVCHGITTLAGLPRRSVIIESIRQFFPIGGAVLLSCGIMASMTMGTFPGTILSLALAIGSVAAAVKRARARCGTLLAVKRGRQAGAPAHAGTGDSAGPAERP